MTLALLAGTKTLFLMGKKNKRMVLKKDDVIYCIELFCTSAEGSCGVIRVRSLKDSF